MEYVAIPRTVWENLVHKVDFIQKTIVPLAKGYKPEKWMTEEEVLDMLEIGKDRLKQLRASGQIRLLKPATGRKIKYWRVDIEDYLAGNITIPSVQKKKP